MGSVALVTCRELPEPDPDERPLLHALREVGLGAELLAWDDPAGSPSDFDLCVLRSCWDYYKDPEGFLGWIEDAAAVSRLLNEPRIVRWNLHKRYLRDLEAAGVEVVPTAWLERGAAADLPALMGERGWEDVVVKPAVSAASYRTRRVTSENVAEGQAFLAGLAAQRDVMVQPYLQAIEAAGELAVVCIDGEITHAVRKRPRFEEADEEVSGALPVPAEARAVAERAFSCVADRVGERFAEEMLYGRVDLMLDAEGRPLVSELELIEPSLFLVQHPPAMRRLVGAITEWCRRI